MASKVKIYGGKIIGVYDDRLIPLYSALGIPVIKRVSSVEHNGHEWVATQEETGVVIGHSKLRAEAVAQEVTYLEDRL